MISARLVFYLCLAVTLVADVIVTEMIPLCPHHSVRIDFVHTMRPGLD